MKSSEKPDLPFQILKLVSAECMWIRESLLLLLMVVWGLDTDYHTVIATTSIHFHADLLCHAPRTSGEWSRIGPHVMLRAAWRENTVEPQ